MRKATWTTDTCDCCGGTADVLVAKHRMGNFNYKHIRCKHCRNWCPQNGPCFLTNETSHVSAVEEMPEPLHYPNSLTFTEVSEIPPKRKSPR